MWLIGLGAAAMAQAPADQDYQPPNTTVQAALGTPYLVALRGEQWLAEGVSGQLGVAADSTFESFGGTWAVRWRPDFACINCGERIMVTLGLGPGGLVGADFDGGPWGFTVGGDLDATGVYWFSTSVGLSVSVNGGLGASWIGTDFGALDTTPWFYGALGLAF